MALESGLYEIALSYLQDEKDKKEFWPSSIEIIGQSLIKLGRYNEAIKIIGPIILLEEIPEDRKLELRYLLASGYEGLGDFENALREIEHIMAIEPNYRDIKEIYSLLGGKVEVVETKPEAVVPKEETVSKLEEEVETYKPEISLEPEPIIEEVSYQEPETIVEKPAEELTTQGEESFSEEKIPVKEEYAGEEKLITEEKGENITFL
ncbi:MAG: hypothetical protein ABIL15_05730, partial [candidate division WOR-3 bacterium]